MGELLRYLFCVNGNGKKKPLIQSEPLPKQDAVDAAEARLDELASDSSRRRLHTQAVRDLAEKLKRVRARFIHRSVRPTS